MKIIELTEDIEMDDLIHLGYVTDYGEDEYPAGRDPATLMALSWSDAQQALDDTKDEITTASLDADVGLFDDPDYMFLKAREEFLVALCKVLKKSEAAPAD